MNSESEPHPVSVPSKPAHGDNWKDRFAALSIDSIVVDERAFKVQLAIGEDTYLSSRLWKRTGTVVAMATGGTMATSSVVASTFFSSGGILGLLGLGTAATPVGWVLGAAAVSGLFWKYGKPKLASMLSGPVETVPKFINTSIDVLALALFELMAPLALKIAMADGEFHGEERSRIEEYFTKSWGYDPAFVELGISYVEADMSKFDINRLSKSLAELANDSPDCNYTAMTNRIAEFLQELIEADGKIHEEEERALDEIRQIFNDNRLVNRVMGRAFGKD